MKKKENGLFLELDGHVDVVETQGGKEIVRSTLDPYVVLGFLNKCLEIGLPTAIEAMIRDGAAKAKPRAKTKVKKK